MRESSDSIAVDVCVFAGLRERLGTGRLTVTVPVGSTASDVFARLFPAEAAQHFRVMYAVGQTYVSPQHVLAAGDEVALVPPLGGG